MVKIKETSMRYQLEDILTDVSWRQIAQDYFGKSSSWIYHKLNGIDGNGGEGGFSPEEKEQLRGALTDIANRIRKAADTIV